MAVVIFLHAIIPHRHHEDMTDEEHHLIHQKADNLVDYLSLVFHEAPKDSFETYIFSQQKPHVRIACDEFDSLLDLCFNHIELTAPISGFYLNFRPERSFHELISSSNGLRAPPCRGHYA